MKYIISISPPLVVMALVEKEEPERQELASALRRYNCNYGWYWFLINFLRYLVEWGGEEYPVKEQQMPGPWFASGFAKQLEDLVESDDSDGGNMTRVYWGGADQLGTPHLSTFVSRDSFLIFRLKHKDYYFKALISLFWLIYYCSGPSISSQMILTGWVHQWRSGRTTLPSLNSKTMSWIYMSSMMMPRGKISSMKYIIYMIAEI